MLSEERRQQIAKRLYEKIEKFECPFCHKSKFTIVDGYLPNNLQDHLNGLTIGGPMMPTIAIVCNYCGFVSQHSLGVLGLMDDIKNNADK